ncbi:MAG: aminoacetone oxidase family FAD-binding enzyme [Anaerolineaceae bacterium]|nr:aminoacetone oxidase family FAD-binding enzyme [Anaerolineaceae bacterium]
MKTAVIGAGAAGIMAALQASKGGMQVVLFEHNPSIGKKLLVTGSGRANLSNENLDPSLYHSDDPDWMAAFLNHFGFAELNELLEKLGIPTIKTDDGWLYPLSQSAHSVVEILKERLEEAGLDLRLASEVEWFSLKEGQFELKINQNGEQQKESFDALILAAGGKAYPDLGSKGTLFPVLKSLGHTVLPISPALGPIFAELGVFKALKGQRFDAVTSIYLEGERLASSYGNLIITEKGFNGPGVMNLSHHLGLHPGKELELQVNFLGPFWEGLAEELADLEKAQGSLRSLLLRALNPKAVDFFLEQAKIPPKMKLKALQGEELLQLLRIASDNRFKITGAGDFKNSQTKVGGVPVNEVDPESFESKIIPRLYLVGETNNVAGPCGGYNIHYAFGSGFLAGKALAGSNT